MSAERQYQIVQGGVERRVYGASAAKRTVERAAHTLVTQTTDGTTAKDQPHANWFTDLRRGRMNIYGGLLRFIDHLHRRNVPMETALLIPEWIAAYIRDVWTGKNAQDDAVRMVRTGEYEKAG
jgi:hypothetical protein